MFFHFIGIAIALVTVVITLFKRRQQYWQRRGIESIPGVNPFSRLKERPSKSHGEVLQDMYNDFKSKGLKHGGSFALLTPKYIPVDLGIIKNIMTSDFAYFMNHGVYVNEKDDPLTGHLFFLEDTKWRNMRTKLTPTFTSGKMKMMFQILADCSDRLTKVLEETRIKDENINIKSILQRFTIDIIGSAAFGIECNCLNDSESEFYKYGRMSFEFSYLRIILTRLLPHGICRWLGLRMHKKEVIDFFLNLTKQVVEQREQTGTVRKDFMQLLIQLRNQGIVKDEETLEFKEESDKKTLSMEELTAQAFVFFVAGFETSSTTMTFAMYELATNPDIQDRLRSEVIEVLSKNDGKLSYESVMEMKYLERVIFETLRKYPPLSVLSRKCTKDYKVPGSDLVIKKGTSVDISALGIQRDPQYYPEPDKFDPDRFTDENKLKRPNFTWLPFGEGPRLCIGMRFGLMQSKVGLASIIRKFKVSLDEKTMLPLKLDPSSFILSPKDGVWICLEPVN